MTQKKPKLGVLALMLEDYLPLFPGIDRAQTAYVNEVLDGLRDAAEFVFPHAAMNRAQIESLVAQYNHEKLDGILILLLTYSQGAYLVRALEENHLPLALALIQPEQTVRPDFIEWDYTVNQGIHGSQDQANVMTRMGVNCVYYAGNRCDGSFVRFVADFGRAAMTVRAMKRMRIGVIGKLPGMGTSLPTIWRSTASWGRNWSMTLSGPSAASAPKSKRTRCGHRWKRTGPF